MKKGSKAKDVNDSAKDAAPTPEPQALVGVDSAELANGVYSIEVVELARLRPHPKNYKVHPDDQLAHIMQMMRQVGFFKNIVVADDYTILAGHGVALAAAKAGYERVPVKRMPFSYDTPQAIKLLTADNEISNLAEDDDRLLSQLLKEVLDTDSAGLLGTGFDESMLQNLVYVTRPASEVADFDEAAHWVGMPEYDAGDQSRRIIIHFENDEARLAFLAKFGFTIRTTQGRTWSMWYPEKTKDDPVNVKFLEPTLPVEQPIIPPFDHEPAQTQEEQVDVA